MNSVGLSAQFCWSFQFHSGMDIFLLKRGLQYLSTILFWHFENDFWWLLLHDRNVLLTGLLNFRIKFKWVIFSSILVCKDSYPHFMNILFTVFFISLCDLKWLKVEYYGWLYLIFITFTIETNRRWNYLSKD